MKSPRLRRILPALALVGCVTALLTLTISAATPRELADEYCFHTNAMWCVDSDGDGTRESAPQLHPLFTEEGIEHLREKARYFDPNDVVEYGPDPTPTPTPTSTPTPVPTSEGSTATPRVNITVGNLAETRSDEVRIGNFASVLQGATGFSTGGASGGYTLVSVAAAFSSPSGSPGNIVVAVHASSSGNPAAEVVRLTGDNPTTAGTHTFTCSGSCSLAANTDYFLVLKAPNAPLTAAYNWDITASDTEAKVPSGNGWSLANTGKYKIGQGNWQDIASGSGKFEITAYY